MLKRPFTFGGLSNPLQMNTILYAYSEQPIFEMELEEEGREILEIAKQRYESPESLFSGGVVGGYHWNKGFREPDEDYEERFMNQWKAIERQYSNIKVFKGSIVQCYVENQQCRFFPDEYVFVSLELFEEVLNGDDYFFIVENERAFNTKEMQDKVHYLQSRGIPKELSKRFSSASLKDNVYFKPKPPILTLFARDKDIYLPDTHYTEFFQSYGIEEPVTSFEDFFSKHPIEAVESLNV